MSGREVILKIQRQYVAQRVFETALFSIGLGLFIKSILSFIVEPVLVNTLAAFGTLALLLTRIWLLKLYRIKPEHIARYLNNNFKELAQSSDLVLNNQELTSLQKLQQQRTEKALLELQKKIKPPHHLLPAVIIFSVSILFLVFIPSPKLNTHEATSTSNQKNKNEKSLVTKPLPVEIKSVLVTIKPPSYTKINKHSLHELNINAAEGSLITWNISFDPIPEKLFIKTSDDRRLELLHEENGFSTSATFYESGFYHLEWVEQGTTRTSDFYKIEIKPDKSPVIEARQFPQFTAVDLEKQTTVDFSCDMTDDYGITNAHIIATVSKGSGESVKFREEKLFFSTPTTFSKTNHHAERKLDFLQLGMEPGDELYFYVEAIDNKNPVANLSRTDTYFISLKDTAEIYAVDDSGLGVDLMPEYFRSQRQIIIDTEKLLRDRKKIVRKEFNFTSNELGYDQKVLRLRYGQFMGEEFESELTDTTPLPEETSTEEDEDPLAGVTHNHDTDNEHNLVPVDAGHEEEDEKNPLKKFIHNHDNAETATFFTQTIRSKLKAALTQMWDAELYLRLFEPEKSLPYQYKALELLKEISNDSRIYVHKTGLDAPPIKEDKRLSADLNEVSNSNEKTSSKTERVYPAMRNSLPILEQIIENKTQLLTDTNRKLLQEAGNELASVVLQNPALISTLTALQQLTDNNSTPENRRTNALLVRKIFSKLIPREPTNASARNGNLHSLDAQFLNQLKAINR